nr:tetratricopeptide repeat protein [Geomicrobium halophilum]
MCEYQLGQIPFAMARLQRVVELDPQDVEARFYFALTLAQSQLLDEAIKEFQSVINDKENHADAHYNLGVAYHAKAEDDKALDHFNRALSAQPDHLLAANGKKQVEEERK